MLTVDDVDGDHCLVLRSSFTWAAEWIPQPR